MSKMKRSDNGKLPSSHPMRILLGAAALALLLVMVAGYFRFGSFPTGTAPPLDWPLLQEKLEGRIAFQVPEEMKQGEEQKVTVRISANTTEELGKDLGGSVTPKVETIGVFPHMTVKLIGGEAFDIKPLTPEEQFVAEDTFTQWQFNVLPLESGEQELDLLVGVRVVGLAASGQQEQRFYPTFTRKVKVSVDRVFSVKHWFKEYWKWLVGGNGFPALLLLLKKVLDRGKKEKAAETKEGEKKEGEAPEPRGEGGDEDTGKGDN